jgi:TRAP transporter TAXI family solute receptor
MRSKKRFFALCVVVCFVLSMHLVIATVEAKELKQLRLLSSSVGGQIFPLQAYWAYVVGKDLKIPVGAFPGSAVSNLKLVNKGEGEMSYGTALGLNLAWEGKKPFKDKIRNIRWICQIGLSTSSLLVLKNSSIQSIDDLLGKKVGVGFRGSTAELISKIQLAAAGLTNEKMRASGGLFTQMNLSDLGTALGDKTIDAYWVMGPAHVAHSSAKATDERFGVRVVPVPVSLLETIVREKPFLAIGNIEGGVYKGSPNPVPVLAVPCHMVVGVHMNENLVYRMLNIIYRDKNTKYVRDNIKMWAKFGDTKDGTVGFKQIPMHPGAKKFWKEKGVKF